MAGSVLNEKVEPMQVTFGETVSQIEQITCVADVSLSLQSKYFLIYTAAGVKNYVWCNVNSAGTDPAVSGGTGKVVAIPTNSTAAAIATLMAAAISTISGMTATASGSGSPSPAHPGPRTTP